MTFHALGFAFQIIGEKHLSIAFRNVFEIPVLLRLTKKLIKLISFPLSTLCEKAVAEKNSVV